MSYPAVRVARDVCGEIPLQMPPNLDCSLCGLGWPQASGEVMFNLYRGDACSGSETGILGDYSYWLNGANLPGRYRLQCRNPGPDAEPNPNEWIAGGDFSWGGTWRLDCSVTVVTKTSVTLTGTIKWLNPATMKLEVWASFSKTMNEDNPQGITDPRRHRIFKSGKVAITPNAASGGIGDPVTHISFVLGTRPMIIGCGTELCSMWDGAHYYTCFRAEVTSEASGGIPALSQMGKSQQPCGGRDDYGQFRPWCNCDRITLRADGQHNAVVNEDPAFIAEYGHVGSPPVDAVQQVQVGGGLLVKRWGSGPTRVWTQDTAGTWVEGTVTVSKDFGPTIWTVTFGSPQFRVARLFSLAFPNPGILPDACEPDPAPPDPEPYRWYCVNGTCIQANVRPPNATGGPYGSYFECAGSTCAPPPPTKWYCVNNACGEHAVAPVGSTGPFDSRELCEVSCQPPPPDASWWCVDGSCVQTDIHPPGSTGPFSTAAVCQSQCGLQPQVYVCNTVTASCSGIDRNVAVAAGITFYENSSDCQTSCIEVAPDNPFQGYYCVPENNGSYGCISWGGTNGPPNNASGGKYDSLEDCVATCAEPPPSGLPYWCVQSADIAVKQCARAETAPPGTVSGPYPTQVQCFEACMVVTDPVERGERSERSYTTVENRQDRFWLPCVHRGEEIPDSGFT